MTDKLDAIPGSAGRKIIDGLKDAIAGNFASVTIAGQRWVRADAPSAGEPDGEDEAYEIGKRDGYSEAVQRVDMLTGGDGEYRYCTDGDPDRHTPDPETMTKRIVERFQVQQSAATRAGNPDDHQD